MSRWDEAAAWYVEQRAAVAPWNVFVADRALACLGPVDGQSVLDVGCGEGHVARRLAALGARVHAVDPTPALLAAAKETESGSTARIRYDVDRAEALVSVAESGYDAALALLSLHHVEQLEVALVRIRSALRTGGRLVVVVPHPWAEHEGASWSGPGDGHRVVGDYLVEGYWSTSDPGDPVTSVHDIGWHHRTIGTWVKALVSSGLALEALEEWAAPPELDVDPRWRAVPKFLALLGTNPA